MFRTVGFRDLWIMGPLAIKDKNSTLAISAASDPHPALTTGWLLTAIFPRVVRIIMMIPMSSRD